MCNRNDHKSRISHCGRVESLMVEQENSCGGTVEHLMVEQWNRHGGKLQRLIMELWNI